MEEADAIINRKQFFNHNIFTMNKNDEMLDLFSVEELEKRYEMGWRAKVKAGPVEFEICTGDAC